MKPKKPSPRKKSATALRPRRAAAGENNGLTAKAAAKTPRRTTMLRKKKTTPPDVEATAPPARSAALHIPPILLEGDEPAARPASGPGQRYALGPTPPAETTEPDGDLPESYGTKNLLLAARDPHWLYAHWDLSQEQQRRYNALSRDRHLVLKVFIELAAGRPATEVHIHPESRHWFVHVPRAGTTYLAELGYYRTNGDWVTVTTSGATFAPPDTASSDTAAQFVSIPFELPMEKLIALVKEAVQQNLPLADALRELRSQGHPELPAATPPAAGWTPAQERALADVISMDQVRRVWMGSLEITELIRRQALNELASQAAAQFGATTSPSGAFSGAVSSFGGREQPQKGFWFNINAELIVYGATEPNASVAIGGRPIKLRPDGSFSYRFALPDGQYELPVVAVSADQTDGRAAELRFSRGTEYRGEVGAHPQDPGLPQLTLDIF